MSPGFVRSLSIIQSLRPRPYERFTQQTCFSWGRYTVRANCRQMALRSESAHPDRVHGPTVRSQETLTSRRVRNGTRIDRGHKAHGGETLAILNCKVTANWRRGISHDDTPSELT